MSYITCGVGPQGQQCGERARFSVPVHVRMPSSEEMVYGVLHMCEEHGAGFMEEGEE